jgi:hypothetical protein
MELRIEYGEIGLRNLVKAAGGKWNREKQVWELPYQEVLRLGLVERIIDGKQNPQDGKSDISRMARDTKKRTKTSGKTAAHSPTGMFGKSGLMKPNLALADLPPALEKRFRDVVQNHYKGDIQTALAGFLDLHDKHGASAANGRAKSFQY